MRRAVLVCCFSKHDVPGPTELHLLISGGGRLITCFLLTNGDLLLGLFEFGGVAFIGILKCLHEKSCCQPPFRGGPRGQSPLFSDLRSMSARL